jgi:hypothetical protein
MSSKQRILSTARTPSNASIQIWHQMRFLLKRSPKPETHHNHEMKRASTSHLARCQLSAVSCYVSLHPNMFTIFYVTCNYHEYVMNNKATMKETSKNCVSDYPLSNTESAERGVKRGILRNRNERLLLRMCVQVELQVESKSSRWFGKGATSSIVTADVDIPDKVLRSGSIWQKCERRGRARHFCCGLSGHQEQEQEQEQRDEVGEGVPPGSGSAAGTCDRVVKASEGSSREFARTVGDNGPGPCLLGLGGVECHGSVRGSVRRLRAPVRKSRKDSYLLKNGLLCWKSAA